ncbi:MAG: hypothetical protein NC548_65380 [Lachnospiraceae bacterium]|nr:hypothetical protein [Lachnospiraceae bacterium]
MMKAHKFSVWILAAISALTFMAGCGGSGNVDVMQLIQERDSLRLQAEVQSRRLGNIEMAVAAMNATVDSIAREEEMIFINYDGAEVTRQGALGNLDRFEEMIRRQDQKIKELQGELAKNDFNSDAQTLISNLQLQIQQKNAQIAQLRKELENKNVDIAKLRQQVAQQSLRISAQDETIQGLETKTEKQGRALQRQDAILNTGYVLVGSKEELRAKGIIDKKGKIVGDGMLDQSKFAKVDIRKWNEVSFSAKKPRILTNMPQSAYVLTTTGYGQFVLRVTNPTDFWKFSPYLIIQTY